MPFRLRLAACSRWVLLICASRTAKAVSLVVSLAAVAIVAPASAETNSPPSDQAEFLAAVEAGRAAYATTGNDIAKEAARPARARALCFALQGGQDTNVSGEKPTPASLQVTGWLGLVTELSGKSDGGGVISIRIGKNAYIKTYPNWWADGVHARLFSRALQYTRKL